MSRLEQVESEIQRMSPGELASLRAWFAEFDAQAWDLQFEQDVKAGRFDELTVRALRDHEGGNSTPL
jgi:hypothetical protein